MNTGNNISTMKRRMPATKRGGSTRQEDEDAGGKKHWPITEMFTNIPSINISITQILTSSRPA